MQLIEEEKKNLMSADNLAIVIGPNLLWSEQDTEFGPTGSITAVLKTMILCKICSERLIHLLCWLRFEAVVPRGSAVRPRSRLSPCGAPGRPEDDPQEQGGDNGQPGGGAQQVDRPLP